MLLASDARTISREVAEKRYDSNTKSAMDRIETAVNEAVNSGESSTSAYLPSSNFDRAAVSKWLEGKGYKVNVTVYSDRQVRFEISWKEGWF